MIVGIIVSLCVIGGVIYGSYKFNKKLNKSKVKFQEQINKEFEDGKIVLPIDKRDFANLKEFKENTSHIDSIKEKMDTLDKDFDNLEFKGNEKEENPKDGQ